MTTFLIEHRGINLALKDSSGLAAYEQAAKEHSFHICKSFNRLKLPSSCYYYYLAIIERAKVGNHMVWRNICGSDSMCLRDLSESDDLLPIDGYWEWIDSDWLSCD